MAPPETDIVVRDPFFQDLVTALNSRPQPPGQNPISYRFFLERIVYIMNRVQALGAEDQDKVRKINEAFIGRWNAINAPGVKSGSVPWKLALFWGCTMTLIYIQPWAMRPGGSKLELLVDLRKRMLEARRERVEAKEVVAVNHEELEGRWMPLILKLTGGV